jgi:ATP-dependent DNA helicase RecG
MINLCAQSGLPAPDFRQEGGQFVQTLWRDWLTATVMDELGLNDRQRKAVAFVKLNGRITNREYQQATGAIARTAARDLEDLAAKGILRKVGTTGRSAHYVLQGKHDTRPE